MPELSCTLQAKLLRVVEDGQVTGLGESTPVGVDVRIVSASQQPLRDLVGAARLRQDLAARLSGLVINLPTLAQRPNDIAPLFNYFLTRQSGGRPPAVEARLIEALCLHDWPENVRELDLVARRLLAVHGHEPTLQRSHLPSEIASLVAGGAAEPRPPLQSRREHDLALLKEQLSVNGGNVKAAATALGISRQRVYRLLDGGGETNGDASRD